MMVVVSYDVSTVDATGRRRLRRVAKACKDWGQRVQNSVFECVVEPAQWVTLRVICLRSTTSEKTAFVSTSWEASGRLTSSTTASRGRSTSTAPSLLRREPREDTNFQGGSRAQQVLCSQQVVCRVL